MGVVRHLRQISADDSGIDVAFRADVRAGLTQAQKAIPARWFYDATGSALFEDITPLPEDHPTRSGTDLLQRHASALAAAIGTGRAVVGPGEGSQTQTQPRIPAAHSPPQVPLHHSCAITKT